LFSCVVASLFRGCESKIQKKRGKKKNISATSGKMVPLFLRKKPIDIEQQQTKQTTTTTTEKVPKKHLKTSMSVVEDLFTTIDLTRQRCVCVYLRHSYKMQRDNSL
jgi:hypothetical protein